MLTRVIGAIVKLTELKKVRSPLSHASLPLHWVIECPDTPLCFFYCRSEGSEWSGSVCASALKQVCCDVYILHACLLVFF